MGKKLEIEIIGKNSVGRGVNAARSEVGDAFDDMAREGNEAFDDIERGADDMGTSLGQIGGVVAGAFALDAVIDFGQEMFSLGTQLETMGVKVDTVFAGASDSVRQWADDNNEAFGLGEQQLAGLAAGFGDLLKPMGFTAGEAATMSTEVLDLAGALSAWSAGQYDVAEVSNILSDAMLGEREQLKGLGINISEADVQARLAANGQAELTGEALAQAEALATQQLIMERSVDAQQAWADGSMEATRAQNEISAAVADFKEGVATGLLPVFGFLMDGIQWFIDHKEATIGMLTALGTVVGVSVVPTFWAWATATIAATWPLILIGVAIAALVAGVIWAYENVGWFRDAIDTAAHFLTNVVWPAIQQFADFIGEKFAWLADAASHHWNYLKDSVGYALDWIKDKWDWLWGYLEPAIQIAGDVLGGVFDGLAGTAEAVFNGIAGAWNNTIGSLSFTVPGWVPSIGGNGFDVPDIPYVSLAQGGIVKAQRGGILAQIGEGRFDEAVVPLDGKHQMGNVYKLDLTVNAGMGTDGPAVGRQIARELESFFRSGGRLAGVA